MPEKSPLTPPSAKGGNTSPPFVKGDLGGFWATLKSNIVEINKMESIEMPQIQRLKIVEAILESNRDYDNPFWDVTVQVNFTSPSGKKNSIDAFWDGGRIWRVRFCPDEIGEWQWRSECSDSANTGLHEQQGNFHCVNYEGDNPVYLHGTPKLSDNRRYFVYADGTPFFWLSDTAWNGVLRAKADDWNQYLQTRNEQGFTAIQFVSTQWRGHTKDSHGETAFAGTKRSQLNPQFFQQLDAKVVAINEHGLIAAPVILWALGESDPGQALSEEDAIRVARYIVARWGAYQVIWFLGGDGNYGGERAERWKKIGRAVFGDRHDRLVTMHPCGRHWVADEFRHEEWFDFIGYQSGHGDSLDHLRWLVMGSPATDWAKEPLRPIINLEPNYETHISYHSKRRFTDFEVRRAAYWSLLVAPPAGVSFGHNSIWVWPEAPELPEGHERLGTVAPWREGLDTPGIRSMSMLRQFFESITWWRLRPATEMIVQQPGKEEPNRFVAAARTDNGDLAVVYLPEGGVIDLQVESVKRPTVARWFNPRAGEWTTSGTVTKATQIFNAPDKDDWVLCIEA